MNAPPCMAYPHGVPAHGASQWHTTTIVVTIIVIVTACAGLSPECVTALAALITAVSGNSHAK